MHVWLCVYQLSVSVMCVTPEQADRAGAKVKVEPVWASWLTLTPEAQTHTRTHRKGGMCYPPSRLISPLGLGSRQNYIDPKHTHTHTVSPAVDLLGHKMGLGCTS